MAQKINQNKTYIAVNIPENSSKAPRKSFWSVFKRDASTKNNKEAKEVVSATPRINKTDLARLLSLAKPEKWKLFGKYNRQPLRKAPSNSVFQERFVF